MDPALKEAATKGNVSFLIKSVSQKDSDYFLTQIERVDENKIIGNIFHLAAWHDQVLFFREAMERLPKELVKQLMFQDDDDGWTPLHVAVQKGPSTEDMVKLIIDFYKSMVEDGAVGKPWLAPTPDNRTPLHVALCEEEEDEDENEKCAMLLLSLDVELLINMVSDDGQSPLFLALKNGFAEVAETILKMPSFSVSGVDGSTPLHFAPKCSESVLRLMLEKCPECLDKFDNRGFSVLHEWVEIGEVWPFKLVLDCDDFPEARTKIFKELVVSVETMKSHTPLHKAAMLKSSEVGEVLIKGYQQQVSSVIIEGEMEESASSADECLPPWRMKNKYGYTPLHLVLLPEARNVKLVSLPDIEFALKLLSVDQTLCQVRNNQELLSNMDSAHGESPLFLAVKYGYSQVAETILKLPSFSVSGKDGSTPLHFAPKCSESVLRLMLEKCPECLDKFDKRGFSVLHEWAKIGEVWPLKLVLDCDDFPEARTKIFKELVVSVETEMSDTPLHKAAMLWSSEVGEVLIKDYQQQVSSVIIEGEMKESASSADECLPPWRMINKDGNTPLHLALLDKVKNVEFALKLLSVDPSLCQVRNNQGTSPFLMAVSSGCERVVEEILRIGEPRFDMIRRNDGRTVLHCLNSVSEQTGRMLLAEQTGRMLLEKYWWIINLADDKGMTALDHAKQDLAFLDPRQDHWLVRLLKNPSLINKQPFDWIAACKKKDTQAVLAFIDHCQDLQQVCRKENDTPLHHIKLPTYEDYVNFLTKPSIGELKNTTDYDGATPLHRALEREDIHLAKALLDDGVERIIPDNNRTTAMDLLAKLCKKNDDWALMCKEVKVNPNLRTTYIQSETNLDQMRNTLSVVAALLATITFAAGFTLPGGITSTGEALLAKKAAFLVFILADVYAMCTSMLVLFCLMWSMVSESDMARLLVDRSVFILMQSLYGTLLAFMTGIYTVIADSSLWAAILIFAMCAVIGISANRTVLHRVIAKLVPAASKEKDRLRLLEEGNVGPPSLLNDPSRKAE